MKNLSLKRIKNEISQAWTVSIKDIKVYYLTPGMIMFGFLMPFFMFFSYSVGSNQGANEGLARLLAMTSFFTAGAAGPFIIPTERRIGTYNRLLAAPMSLLTLLLGKTATGAIFAITVSGVALSAGLLLFGTSIAQPLLLTVGIILSALTFSSLGLIFGSIPTTKPGDVQMPSTLLRWGLLFISGVFVPMSQMAPAMRFIAYLSPLTYAQDLMNHAVIGEGLLNPWIDMTVLLGSAILFLIPSIKMHHRAKIKGV
ncbi:MAG: ABC transporter permease [Chloroflexota bacterium]|jgi:ABC-2 type transport system permease protein|nr:ABC transporter permease [Chloroflexota bacterium]